MQIQRDGKINDVFAEELSKRLKKDAAKDDPAITEKQLDDAGEQKNDEGANKAQISETMEPQLNKERSDEAGHKEQVQQLPEAQLEEKRSEKAAAAPNADKEGITEQRLNESSKTAYPHRNPEAWERTGDKRPVNALREEMGKASDAAKNERYQAVDKAGEKRVVDKDVGKQKTLPVTKAQETRAAFNLHAQAPKGADRYIAYRKNSSKFASVKETDTLMENIMGRAQREKRDLTKAEMDKIASLKTRKAELLKVALPEGSQKKTNLLTAKERKALNSDLYEVLKRNYWPSLGEPFAAMNESLKRHGFVMGDAQLNIQRQDGTEQGRRNIEIMRDGVPLDNAFLVVSAYLMNPNSQDPKSWELTAYVS